MRRTNAIGWRLAALLAILSAASSARAADEPLAAAREMFLKGQYAEAEEAYRALAEDEPVAAALGLARCQAETGQADKAIETIEAAAKGHPDEADLPAELSLLALDRGDYKTAESQSAAVLKLKKDHLAARWVAAELLREAGELDKANKAYKWFVDYYNDHEVDNPESLRWIGLAAAQYARWNRLHDQFSFLVNDLYPDAVKADKAYWPAHYESGLLFLEKYNQADAAREFNQALALNPHAAEVHAALAALALQDYELEQAQKEIDEALAINARLLDAHLLQADIHLANFEAPKAVEVLQAALKLNPVSDDALGRLAAAYAVLDGQDEANADTRMGKLVAAVNERNPHAGDFYVALADSLDRVHRYPAAAHYYQEAIDRMPQLTGPRGQWGLMLMRLGEEAEAKKLLDESFEADPFNVRVSNTLKVLEVLDGYETLETAHFRIKFDPQKDKILARYASAWLEDVYPQLCQQFGFEPPDKSLFEIFNKSRNTDGHGWFSARMVGLPHIHTIGACAGKMVAMQSPTEGAQKFNWARVLKHEFVHVLNLQQTHFNIPHWYTEALAVLNEGYPPPPEWNDILAQRLAKNELFNLDTINLGFIRPHSSDDWSLAYYQAELYAKYLLLKYGDDALAKMLAAYADNLSTPDALRRSFGVDQAELEKGYRAYLNELVAALPAATKAKTTAKPLVELQKDLKADPKNADLLAQMAIAYLHRQATPEARKFADDALAAQPHHPLATFVKAALLLKKGDKEAAITLLREALDEAAPDPTVLDALAEIRLKDEDYSAAALLYELGLAHDPANREWLKKLAHAYLKSGDKPKMIATIAKVVEQDGDEFPLRKRLAQLSLADKDYATAARAARQALQINVMDAEIHGLLGDALAGDGDSAGAIEEYKVSLEIKPEDQSAVQFSLAAAHQKANQPDEARAVLEAILKRDPKYPGAAELLESLGR